jgi:hypothetical protein
MGPVWPDIRGRVVEKSQHHVVVETIQPACDLKLVPAQAQACLQGHLGAGPFPIAPADFQIQVGRGIQPHVVLVPQVGTRAAPA